jgi:hypothetical protein
MGDIPRPALVLGVAGLVPFLGAAFVALVGEGEVALWGRTVLAAYGACILAFLGGVHWGLAVTPLAPDPRWNRLGLAVLPAVIGWGALTLLPTRGGLLVMAASFALLLAHDQLATRIGQLPPWYLTLRRPLTLVAVVCLGLPAVF